MQKLLAELKRRQMFRVAAAYAVVAWLLLQVVNNVAPVLDLPPWVARAFLLLLVIGFPISLLFVWMHELSTPTSSADGASAQAKITRLDFALVGGLALVLAVVAYQQLASSSGTSATQQASLAPGASQTQPQTTGISIAVLPFVNLSSDPEQEFFSDGMTEEITASLVKVPDLHVVGRSSAFQFKGQSFDLRTVGQTLGASHVIEGSVRKAGDRVRITAELVRADNGLQLWSENYDRQLTDIFTIQEDIAQAIVRALRIPLGLQQGETLVRSRTKDDTTYEDYLRGRSLIRARGHNRLVEAGKILETVVAREPGFAPGWAQLALAYAYVPYYDPDAVTGAFERWSPLLAAAHLKAETAARRAIQLDPKSPEAFLVLGIVLAAREKFSDGQEMNQRALALDPDNPEILYVRSLLLADLGYLKQALAGVQRLRALEPFAPIYNSIAAWIMSMNGQDDAAIAILKPLAASGSGLGNPATNLARVYAAQGRYREAADALLLIPDGAYTGEIRDTAARLMRNAPAAAEQPAPRLGLLSFVYAFVGASDRILDYREDAHKSGVWSALYYYWAQTYAETRKSERWKALMRDGGYLAYWRLHGWPDLCRPVGADDFVCD
jgi:TolB-like protein